MATIQSMTVALNANIDGFRRGLRRADRQLHDFRGSASDTLTRLRSTFATRGRSLGSALASNMSSALRSAGGMVANAVKGLASKPVVLGAAIAAGAVIGGALVNAFTIALGGLAVVGLSYYILKDVPKVKKALDGMKEDVKNVFKDAAKPMAEPLAQAFRDVGQIIKDLKPEFEEMFQTVADSKIMKNLTDGLKGFLEGFMPGFNDMLKDMKPVFEGLEVLMTKVGEGLGEFFRELGKNAPEAKIVLEGLGKAIKKALIWAGKIIGFLTRVYAKSLQVQEALSEAWDLIKKKLRDFWESIKGTFDKVVKWFKQLPDRVWKALTRFVSNIKKKFTEAKESAVERVKGLIKTAVDKLTGFPQKAWNALSELGSKLKNRAKNAGKKLVDGIKDKIGDAVDRVREFPGKAKDALWNIGSKLYQSGRDLIWGFIDGIKSMAGEIWDAAWNVVDSVSGLFPNSPAKEGPFSGKGWTPHRGKALIDGFRKGMHSAMPAMRKELDNMYGAVPDMRADVSGVIRAGRSKGPVLTVNMTGAPEWLKQGIREIVRTDGGGDVQFTFGR